MDDGSEGRVAHGGQRNLRMKMLSKIVGLSACLALVLMTAINLAEAAGKHDGGHGPKAKHMEKEGHGKEEQGHAAGGHMFEFGGPGKGAEAKRTIDIVMKDNLYEPESITIKAGETIRFRIKNAGEALHEFGLGTEEMHIAHRPGMAMMFEHGMLEVDRINHDRMKMGHGNAMKGMAHDDPNSVLVEPGKSAEIVWKFTKAMAIEFA